MRDLLNRLTPEGRRRALTHSSWAAEPGDSFERLEFLGDSVLGVAVAHELYRRFPDEREGVLSKLRAAVVSRSACALVAQASQLGEAMMDAAPPSADRRGVADMASKERVLAALTESVIGAAFLEFGYSAVAPVVIAAFGDRLNHAVECTTDAKSELQEFAQRQGLKVTYEVTSVEGPDHERHFTIEARFGATGITAQGEGGTKKAGEQLAAMRLLARLQTDSLPTPVE